MVEPRALRKTAEKAPEQSPVDPGPATGAHPQAKTEPCPAQRARARKEPADNPGPRAGHLERRTTRIETFGSSERRWSHADDQKTKPSTRPRIEPGSTDATGHRGAQGTRVRSPAGTERAESRNESRQHQRRSRPIGGTGRTGRNGREDRCRRKNATGRSLRTAAGSRDRRGKRPRRPRGIHTGAGRARPPTHTGMDPGPTPRPKPEGDISGPHEVADARRARTSDRRGRP